MTSPSIINTSRQSPALPRFQPVAASRPGYALPDEQQLNRQLKPAHAVTLGTGYGLVAGAVCSLPVLLFERLYKKSNATSEMLEELAKDLEVFPILSRMAETLKNPRLNTPVSILTTTLLGGILGAGLGWLFVSHVKKKITEIRNVMLEQQQGTFKPPKPNLLSQTLMQLGLKPKPVTHPEHAFQRFMQNDLNPDTAFWHGVKTVLIFKILQGIVVPAVILAAVLGVLRLQGAKELERLIMSQIKPALEAFKQPAVIAKLSIAPIIGGIIAQQLSPWMARQLGLEAVASRQKNMRAVAAKPMPSKTILA